MDDLEASGELLPVEPADLGRPELGRRDVNDPFWPIDREALVRYNAAIILPQKHVIRILDDDTVEFDGEPYPASFFVAGGVNVLSGLLDVLVAQGEPSVELGELAAVQALSVDVGVIFEVLTTAQEEIGDRWPFTFHNPGNLRHLVGELDGALVEDLRPVSAAVLGPSMLTESVRPLPTGNPADYSDFDFGKR